MIKDPCRSSNEREPGCHTRCPDGIEQDRLQKERREKIRVERNKDIGYSDYKREIVDKRVKRAY